MRPERPRRSPLAEGSKLEAPPHPHLDPRRATAVPPPRAVTQRRLWWQWGGE